MVVNVRVYEVCLELIESVNMGDVVWKYTNTIFVTGVTSLHLRSVLGRDSNKELSSIQAKGTSKGWLNRIGTKVKTRELQLSTGSLYR